MTPEALAIARKLERHRRIFDLVEGDLGRRLCRIATDGVQGCIDGQHTPEGVAWAPLSEAYSEWKEEHYPGEPMAVLHHLMADPKEVAGVVRVEPDCATVTYGVTDQARQEAAWFQEGDGRQPPRPFWGLTDGAREASKKILDERFKNALAKS